MTVIARGWTQPTSPSRTTPKVFNTDPPSDWDGEAVRALRERIGLSQATFAAVIGVHRVTVTKWESGARATVEHEAIRRLLDLLDAHPELFLH